MSIIRRAVDDRELFKAGLVQYYLDHAAWPDASKFQALALSFSFHGDHRALIDEAFAEVSKHMRMWGAFEDPAARDEFRRTLGDAVFEAELERSRRFTELFERRESRSVAGRAKSAIRAVARTFSRRRV